MHKLLAAARATATPIVAGDQATFLWEGAAAPPLIGDFNQFGDASPPLTLDLLEPGLWGTTIALPRDAYCEYAFIAGNVAQPTRLNDPLNPDRRAWLGLAPGVDNHWFRMPDNQPSPYAQTIEGDLAGRLTAHALTHPFFIAGGQRDVWLYRPPTDAAVPLVIVWDGQDYRDRGQIVGTVENLIQQGQIRPIALALIDHGDQARFLEYNCADTTLAFVIREVLPVAQQHLHLLATPGVHGVMGASMGGLMALYTGLRAPQIFGKVLAQSGAYGFRMEGIESVIIPLAHAPHPPLRCWLDVGTMEWLYAVNQQMRDTLIAAGDHVQYRAYQGGHNYTSWRDSYWRGLIHLYGR